MVTGLNLGPRRAPDAPYPRSIRESNLQILILVRTVNVLIDDAGRQRLREAAGSDST